MQLTRVHHRFTVDDYEQMIERGILTENDRVELIRGEIIEKMSIGDPHAARVKQLNRTYGSLVGDRILISIQDPIRLADSVPEPDVALLRLRADFYSAGKPQPADILLLIEVSDTSLEYDREVKRALYAEAGIVEYWILNLVDECLEVYRQPQPDGTYRDVQTLRRGQTVEIAALPGLTLAIDEML